MSEERVKVSYRLGWGPEASKTAECPDLATAIGLCCAMAVDGSGVPIAITDQDGQLLMGGDAIREEVNAAMGGEQNRGTWL